MSCALRIAQRQSTVAARAMRTFTSASAVRGKATLPDLPYDYGELEPFINAEIMLLHHSKHHNTYVTNYNAAVEQLEEAVHKGDVDKQIQLQSALKFNGGGHINHAIFWTNLAPQSQGGGDLADGELKKMIEAQWGSVDAFQQKFNATTAAVQGSGWGWLGYDKANKSLVIQPMPNQDPLEPLTGLVPLLGIDVWEHAYYLQYKNVRPDYLKQIWNIVNWKNVEERLASAK
eukprot:Clim_evm18s7 gene=Clim_evmTU18s7